MQIKHKREPAFTDTDLMTFGKYKDKPLQDIPASYVRWLWQETIIHTLSRNLSPAEQNIEKHILDSTKLANYIWNSQDAIALELGESII